MCGRFSVTERDLVRLARALGAQVDPALAAEWRPRFNVAPGSGALLVREVSGPSGGGGALRLERARFGLPGAGAARLQINARVETARERRAFRAAWATRRCVVPADGFYEWGGSARARRPVWFHDPGGRPLLLAALWGEAEDGQLAFSILTTAANGPVAALHDRMPVLVPEGGLASWLAGGEAPGASPEDALVGRPVSERVNAIANDDPGCLEPPEPERQLRLL
jgi:putative SOS response-associated peptidase YedK